MNLSEITLLGWCGIGVLVFTVVSINVWLFSLLRGRGAQKDEASVWKDTFQAIRHPFANENRRYSELREKVKSLKKPGE